MTVLAYLAAILAGLFEALGLLATINGIVQAVRAVLNLNDSTSWANKVLANTATAATLLNDPTYGLGAIRDSLSNITALIVALGDPMQAGSTATLPSTPPAGYGGSGDASVFWAYPLGVSSTAAGDLLSAAGTETLFRGAALVEVPLSYQPGWLVAGPWDYSGNSEPNQNLTTAIDPTTILVTDLTVDDWLLREYPFLTTGRDHLGRATFLDELGTWRFTYWMGNVEFDEYKAAHFGATANVPPQPPIWPGADKVTFAEGSVASDGSQILGPLDGVDVFILAVPTGSQQFGYGPDQAYGHIGALAFFDETGHYEAPQALNFVSAKYLPKSFAHAGGVTIKLKAGTSLAWYPFTINQ